MDNQTRKKISYALKGRKKSATHKLAISQSMKGKKKTQAHREALAESLRRFYLNNRINRKIT